MPGARHHRPPGARAATTATLTISLPSAPTISFAQPHPKLHSPDIHSATYTSHPTRRMPCRPRQVRTRTISVEDEGGPPAFSAEPEAATAEEEEFAPTERMRGTPHSTSY